MRPFVIFAAATLAACTEPGSNLSNGQNSAEQAGPMAPENEVVMSEPIREEPGTGNRAGPMPPENDGDADQCNAGEYQYLVGQPRSRIPEKPAGATWRVTCTSCPITMDYSPARMNIFYDEETEIVEEVRCG